MTSKNISFRYAGIAVVYLFTLLLLLFENGYSQTRKDGGVVKTPLVTSMGGDSLATGTGYYIEQSYTAAGNENAVITNVIALVLNEETSTYISSDFTATLTAHIIYGSSSASTNTVDVPLTVNYKKGEGTGYNPRNYFSFKNAKYVRVSVTSGPDENVSGVSIKKLLRLQNEMQVTAYYKLSATNNTPSFNGQTGTGDELAVSWQVPDGTGHNYLQLEWTWLEDELQSFYYGSGSGVDTSLLFRNNATRLDLPVSKTGYNIPMLYDGQGKLFYRLRAVNLDSTGVRKDGSWSAVQTYVFSGHSDSLNWQSTTSYAEEGKRKTVIQYYDGSLRSRQTVTKDNTTNTTISGETFYDAQGRPAIQVLPVPGINTVIAYTKNLNRFNGQATDEDPATYFDLVPLSGSTNATPAMEDSASAAALYYSSNNPEISNGSNGDIPQAGGYPYTVTRYTQDGTGRIAAQSGVGAALKMGTGRETKYYYGNAAQEELDGLFGTEAGDFSHYFKNMVKDANGQMSVSYVDMAGHTIATALAGDAPVSGIKALTPDAVNYPNQQGQLITRNLLSATSNITKGSSVESINSILVPATGIYTFDYALTPAALQLTSCAGAALSYDCMYNLEISVTDESGDNAPIVKKFNNIKLNPDDDPSTPVTTFVNDTTGAASGSVEFSLTLLPGSYLVRKTLTMSDASLATYKAMYLEKGLCKTQQELIDSVYTVMQATSGCNSGTSGTTCQACIDSLGSYTVYRARYIQGLDSIPSETIIRNAYSTDSARCRSLCTTVSHRLEAIRAQMLMDMTPYTGQYARDKDSDASALNSMYYKYNIFSTSGGDSAQPYFRYPRNSKSQLDYYYNDNDTIDQLIQPGNDRHIVLDTITGREFATSFTSQWAEALLPYHPEYARLLYAEQNLQSSYDWGESFVQDTTYQEAVTNGHLITSASFGSNPNPADPFFTIASSLSASMQGVVSGTGYYGSNLWRTAYGIVICRNITDSTARALCDTGTVTKQPPFAGLSDSQRDDVWNAFKSLYAGVRDSMMNAWVDKTRPVADSSTLVNEKYTLRFATSSQQVAQNGWSSWYPVSSGSAPSGNMADSVAVATSTSCSSYIESWKNQFLQCPAIASMSDTAKRTALLYEITSGMEAVCLKGTDASNPYGSSTVAPTSAYDGTPRSFEEVIEASLTKYGISRDLLCNPFVITYPKPYGKGPLLVKSYTSQVDTCSCQRYSALMQEAADSGYSTATMAAFNVFLRNVYGDTLTAVLYEGLQHCAELPTTKCPEDTTTTTSGSNPVAKSTTTVSGSNVGTTVTSTTTTSSSCDSSRVYVLGSAQPLPEFLKCGYLKTDRCVTCDTLSALTARFRRYFSNTSFSGAPYLDSTELDSMKIAGNVLYANYLNYYTGLDLNWLSYARSANTVACVLTDSLGSSMAHQPVVCRSTTAIADSTSLFVSASPCEQALMMATTLAVNIYEARSEQLLADFDSAYRARCMAAASLETFTVSDTSKEYHYTLYYYDLAGNLVKTVPPKGVHPDFSTSFVSSVASARSTGAFKVPAHTYFTRYCYNSLNQIIVQKTPDADSSSFWYDRLGRLAVSRNAQQRIDGKYSYTQYDAIGRITEVGQKPQTTAMLQLISQDTTALKHWLIDSGGVREQLTLTGYDSPYLDADSYINQHNLRNRVSYTGTKSLATDNTFYSATYYSYDIHGNVDTLLQSYTGLSAASNTSNGFKLICYQYDLISGKVNQVDYQPGDGDQFSHRYTYDAENRLTEVETSRDQIYWERDAAYSYYKHGPLARTILGQQQVQGIDYSYTLHGWLKGVNSGITTGAGVNSCMDGSAADSLTLSSRSGTSPAQYTARLLINFEDGFESVDNDEFATVVNDSLAVCQTAGNTGELMAVSESMPVARDVYGFNLNYYPGDYAPIAGATGTTGILDALSSEATPLYNGNIAAMAVNISKLGDAKVYNYHYDQLNRLVRMDAFNGLNTSAGGFAPITTRDYQEAVTYDPNGNILTYLRHGSTASGGALAMDSLTYSYYDGKNQLKHISDNPAYSSNYSTDIDSQVVDANYTYDAIGNLISDNAENITNITWNVYGKITSITRNDTTITYTYDAAGNRVSKTRGSNITLYVRDATGNIMAVYEQTSSVAMRQTELNLYGSSRLGVQRELTVPTSIIALASPINKGVLSTFTREEKLFELSNHLGNVLATVSDKRLQVSAAGSTVDSYTADVVSAQDYYPFGMLMPGRDTSVGKYRYGFNGKENDNEVKGDGNQQDYGMRIYDPRIGKFLSVDPITADYPELTPYQFASNSPVSLIDIDGEEGGWELSSPAANLKYQYMMMSKLPPKSPTNNPATSNPVALQNPNHSEAPPSVIVKTKAMAHNLSTIANRDAERKKQSMTPSASFVSQWHDSPASQEARFQQNMAGATIDPVAGLGIRMIGGTVASNVNEIASHGYGLYQGIREKDAAMIAGSGALLTLDLLPFRAEGAATETYYRAMREADYLKLVETGHIPATGETSIALNRAYSEQYRGVLVEFNTKEGTFNELLKIGVRNNAVDHPFGNLPLVRSGWGLKKAFFKVEGEDLNILLGQGKALKTFNKNIQSYKVLRR